MSMLTRSFAPHGRSGRTGAVHRPSRPHDHLWRRASGSREESIRHDLVQRVRAEIAADRYETAARLWLAVTRLLAGMAEESE